MKIKDIKIGQTVSTKDGDGVITRVGGTFPPSVQVNIVAPFPRGIINVDPRNVLAILREADGSSSSEPLTTGRKK